MVNNKVLVIGLGVSGRAAAEFLLKKGACVAAVDSSRELLETDPKIALLRSQGLAAYVETDPIDMRQYDLIVVSPGIPPGNPIYQKAAGSGKEIIGEIELACRSISQPFLAITGSNGKTTTTLLIEHVLKHAGHPARALGNVGTPLTQALLESSNQREILVVELSSWQLETMESRVIDGAAILNITPNHLDRHLTMEAYAGAKIRIKNCLKPNKNLWMGIECYQAFSPLLQNFPAMTFGYFPGCDLFCDQKQLIWKGKTVLDLPETYRDKISHDMENLMAAFALCREIGIEARQFLDAFESFKKPPHRIEFIRKRNEISYYDDSKGTNVQAVIMAVRSMPGATILIAGGVHKGTSYMPWINAFAGKVRCVCAMGQAAGRIKAELGQHIQVEVFSTFEDAVAYAAKEARPGESVLLSPGCASYDMFKDYQHRGLEFKRLINAL